MLGTGLRPCFIACVMTLKVFHIKHVMDVCALDNTISWELKLASELSKSGNHIIGFEAEGSKLQSWAL